jgi:preprotein translocase subunit SecD
MPQNWSVRRAARLLSTIGLLTAALATACTTHASQQTACSALPAANHALPARCATTPAVITTPAALTGQTTGATLVTLQLDLTAVPAGQRDAVLQQAVTVVQRRLGAAGVQQATVSVGSAGQILVAALGITPTDAQALLGATGQLVFKEGAIEPTTQARQTDAGGQPVWAPACLDRGCPDDERPLTGQDLNGPASVITDTLGRPAVSFTVTPAGAAILSAVTQRNIGHPVAIFLDDQLLSAPLVAGPITDHVQITGANLNAKQLVAQLNSGALPVPVTQVQVTVR